MKMDNTVTDEMNDTEVGTIQLSYNINGKTETSRGFDDKLHGAKGISMGQLRLYSSTPAHQRLFLLNY